MDDQEQPRRSSKRLRKDVPELAKMPRMDLKKKKKNNNEEFDDVKGKASTPGSAKPRCRWAGKSGENKVYHDQVWGTEIRDSAALFRNLSLVSQQAGVSWNVVWRKREAYAKAFHNFDVKKVAKMSNTDIDNLMDDDDNGIMHNRKKLNAIVNNAKKCLELEERHPGGLSGFLWGFADHKPVVNDQVWSTKTTFSNESDVSKAMAQDMKKRGFQFLGSITLHAFCQQVGIINDHCVTCYKNPNCTTIN